MSAWQGWRGLWRMYLLIPLVVVLVAAGLGIGLGVAFGSVRPAVTCVRGDVEITGEHLFSAKTGIHHQHLDVTGQLFFKIHCTPRVAILDMRLQRKIRGHWVTEGDPVVYDASGEPAGLVFPMSRSVVCARGWWHIRLHVFPGENHEGHATPPETFYFPLKGPEYFTCRKAQYKA